MEEKKVSKKKTSNGKKILVGFLGVGLIVGVTIAGTLAFLKTMTSPVENTFTASSDIKLGLDEPNYNWDPEADTDGDGKKGEPKDKSLPNPADYQPEITYSKDPTLYNLTGTNGTTEEWVAMRVDYTIDGTSVTHTQLTIDGTTGGYTTDKGGLIEPIEFDTDENTGSWIKLATDQLTACGVTDAANVKYEIYVYKYKLKDKNGKTTASDTDFAKEANAANGEGRTTKLFKEITIKNKEKLTANGYADAAGLLTLPEFKITLKGAAVKHDDTVKGTDTIVSANIRDKQDGENEYLDSFEIVKELVGLLK